MIKQLRNYMKDKIESMKLQSSANFSYGQHLAKRFQNGVGKKGAVGYLFNVLFVVLLLSALGTTIFASLNTFKNDGNLTAAEKAMASVIGIFVLAGIVFYFYRESGMSKA